MGLFDSLFGGGGSKSETKSQQTSKSQSESQATSAQDAYSQGTSSNFGQSFGTSGSQSQSLGTSGQQSASSTFLPIQAQALSGILNPFLGRFGQGQPSYQGQRIAGLTPDQLAATDVGSFNDVFSANPNMPLSGDTERALRGILTGQSGASMYTPESVNNYFRESIEAPAMEQYQRFTKPQIQEQYAGPGYWGSARADALTQSGRDLTNFLGQQRSQLGFDVEQANRTLQESKANRALSAIGQAQQFDQTGIDTALKNIAGRSQVASLAGVNQQQAQSEINASIQKFIEENRLTDPEDMQILLQLLGMNFGESYGVGQSKSESQSLSEALNAALSGGQSQQTASSLGQSQSTAQSTAESQGTSSGSGISWNTPGVLAGLAAFKPS